MCCDMGFSGLACCALSTIPNFAAPLGGACYFTALGSIFLQDMQRQYALPSSPSVQCCCGDNWMNRCCETLVSSLMYPCLFFQIYMTLREIEWAENCARNAGEFTSTSLTPGNSGAGDVPGEPKVVYAQASPMSR